MFLDAPDKDTMLYSSMHLVLGQLPHGRIPMFGGSGDHLLAKSYTHCKYLY